MRYFLFGLLMLGMFSLACAEKPDPANPTFIPIKGCQCIKIDGDAGPHQAQFYWECGGNWTYAIPSYSKCQTLPVRVR